MFVCPECGAAEATAGACPSDGAMRAEIGDDVLLGSTIGPYRVARLLGIGGMGRVYKGVHPQIGSRVAIKVLSRECTDRRDLVDRFFAEAKAVNLIRHESIVNVLDLSTLPDGRPYIIMEYLDGAPLASIIEHAVTTRTPLPLGGVARLAVEVLDALAAAHAKGIVHRDLKPDNIFVTPSGRPKVLDFGIAKLNDMSTGSATRTGSLLGTPHYMSPEQAQGKPAEQRADIYAMGVILFECVTGQKPCLAESLFELLRQHIEETPPSPRSLRPEVSPDLEAVILTALGKTPEMRFGSAQAMSAALQHATAQLAPEQWTAITGTGTHRGVPSGAWQPTPPQSWGGKSSPTVPARESVQPQPIPHHSTVSGSAGQLQQPTRVKREAASKKGVWIAIGAIVLAAVGVTVAVVASSKKAKDEPQTVVAKQDEPPQPPPPPSQPQPAQPAPPTKAPVVDEAKQPVEPPKPVEAKPERKRVDEPSKAPIVVEKVEQDSAPAGGAPPAKGSAPIWNGAYDMAGWKVNAKKFDVTAFIHFAAREAKKADSSAALVRIDVDGVGPDGMADFTLPSFASDTGSIDMRFVSMERGKPDPSLPKGVPFKEKQSCEFRIEAEPGGAQIRTISPAVTEAASCHKQKPIPIPRCSAKQIWAKAIAKGAPPNDAVANLSFRANLVGGKIEWWFEITKIFDARFADDC
jgi:serine/threonine-protein kinase